MNLDELKPLWKSYQNQVNSQYHWSQEDLSALLKEKAIPKPWYRFSQRKVLNLAMCLLLLGITGC